MTTSDARVYLDNAATTCVDPRVAEAMAPFLAGASFGNPSSLHPVGVDAARAVKAAREALAASVGVAPERLVFTAGGTEADNLGVKGMARARKDRGRHCLSVRTEHPAVLESLRELAEVDGFDVELVPNDRRGLVDPAEVAARVRTDTVLVAVMHGNNEVGTVQPVERIAALVKEKNARAAVHVDAVQTFGRLAIDLARTPAIDAIAVSGHKLHAPKGVGFLAIGPKARPVPLVRGGGQEGGLRSGTENVPGIVGLARAVELLRAERADAVERARRLRDRLRDGILAAVPDAIVNGDAAAGGGGLAHVLSVSFAGLAGEALLHHLEAEGIDVATGSACAEKKKAPSPVLLALGLSEREARGTIRFSFGRFNTEADVDRTLAVLPRLVAELREVAAA